MRLEGDKRVLTIAFLVSLTVSLFVSLFYTYGGELYSGEGHYPIIMKEANVASPAPGMPGAPGRRHEGGRFGGFGMRPAPPELLALYKKRVEMYEKIANFIIKQAQAASMDPKIAINAVLKLDDAKLAYWRREKGMRPTKGAAEAFLQFKAAQKIQKLAEASYKANTIPLDKLNRVQAECIDAEIQMEEALLRIRNKEAWEKAAKPLEAYPDKVTDELLRGLLAAELASPGAPR